MRNRIAGIMHWEHVGIEHKQAPLSAKGTKAPTATMRNPYAAFAAATLLGVAVIVTLRVLFGGPSTRA
jgi:hypothetical protein